MFKVGDKVRCVVGGSWLKEGGVYVVSASSARGTIRVEGLSDWWWGADRFQPVTQEDSAGDLNAKGRAENWRTYVNRLTQEEKNRLLSVLLEHELEDVDGAVRFRAFDDDPEYGVEACSGSSPRTRSSRQCGMASAFRPAIFWPLCIGVAKHGKLAARFPAVMVSAFFTEAEARAWCEQRYYEWVKQFLEEVK